MVLLTMVANLIGNKQRKNVRFVCVALWMRFTGMTVDGYCGNSRGWSLNGVEIEIEST